MHGRIMNQAAILDVGSYTNIQLRLFIFVTVVVSLRCIVKNPAYWPTV